MKEIILTEVAYLLEIYLHTEFKTLYINIASAAATSQTYMATMVVLMVAENLTVHGWVACIGKILLLSFHKGLAFV
jgi:hypothetical protein